MNVRIIGIVALSAIGATVTLGHPLGNDDTSYYHPPLVGLSGLLMAKAPTQPMSGSGKQGTPQAALPFQKFASLVKTRFDENFIYVESDSMPEHPMMIGITAWQQQVPLPQPYTGDNAWRIPLNPVPAQVPM